MGGASKFAFLLATPFSLLNHRSTSLLRLARTISVAPLSTSTPRRFALSPHSINASSSQEFHTQSNYNPVKAEDHFGGPFTPLSTQHPWPEWSKLVDTVSARGYLDDRRPFDIPDDAFVSYDGLPEHFVRDAVACLAFARDKPDILGLLSRRDIEILIDNGTAFLFKSALDIESRMRSFLGGNRRSYEVESGSAQTVDLMKYIVSYASNSAAFGRNKISNPELTESSVRYLLTELLDMSCRALDTDVNAPEQYQLSGSYGQTPRFLRPKIEMKRGDWICPKCSFMNFARNLKCLECEEPRPKRQLTGGEWECPQCDFHNYGRNLACLRCDCKRPCDASLGNADSRSGWGNNYGNYANKDAADSRIAANEENAQRWFSKVSQQNPSDLNNMATYEDFPEIMPLRKEVNKFVVSTRNTPLDRRSANSQNQNNWGNYDTREDVGAIDGSSPPTSSSSQYKNSRGNNSTHIPFVPLPADMFAKRTQQPTSEDDKETAMKSSNQISSKGFDQTGEPVSQTGEPVRREESFQLCEKPSIEAGTHLEWKEQEGKSELWLKRVQEMHDVPDVANALSDEDFPEIMPMRKGENHFVISKKKDRSLTSPAYKRQMSMEQGSNAEFIPFVPFPPDYFAKKDKQQPDSRDSTLEPMGNAPPVINYSNEVQRAETQQTSTEHQLSDYRGQTYANPTSNSIGSHTSSSDSWKHTASQTSKPEVSPHRPVENPNVRSGWSGKSLEGSAVKEPDPLDMSEEAKTERWFRRVAQIKDISELSQIPDEDFPSIMPMRKGVNRFVVSKRKTPLERRLTSTQYRKNLPVVNSDHVKKENDSS